jgi:glycosylphosphatidylinositol deacylase
MYAMTKLLRTKFEAPLFSPLLMHTSHASEIHYYPLTSDKTISLHTHSSAPYVPPLGLTPSHGLNLTIYSSESSCPIPLCRLVGYSR